MSGVCSTCGRQAPDADELALTLWDGGDDIHYVGADPETTERRCPLCSRLAEASDRPHRLTLDTNLMLELWKDQAKRDVTDELVALAEAGSVELAVTRYIRDDVPSDPLAAKIDGLPELGIAVVGGLFTIGVSTLGDPDVLGSDAFLLHQAELQLEWRPSRGRVPDERDWKHLHAHHAQDRDAFLTWDNALLEAAAELESRCVVVRATTPEEYLELAR